MTALDALKQSRRDIAGRLSLVMDAQAKVREATNAESAALVAIGALGAAEVEAMRVWAEAGGTDPMPEPDIAERKRLAEALVGAQARGQAAQGALAGFDVAQRDLSAELQGVNARIEAAALDRLEERHRAEVETISALMAEHIADRLARCCAFHVRLIEIGQQHQASGRIDAARALYARAERVATAAPPFDITPTASAVLGKVDVWVRRLNDLTSDTPTNVVSLGEAAA